MVLALRTKRPLGSRDTENVTVANEHANKGVVKMLSWKTRRLQVVKPTMKRKTAGSSYCAAGTDDPAPHSSPQPRVPSLPRQGVGSDVPQRRTIDRRRPWCAECHPSSGHGAASVPPHFKRSSSDVGSEDGALSLHVLDSYVGRWSRIRPLSLNDAKSTGVPAEGPRKTQLALNST